MDSHKGDNGERERESLGSFGGKGGSLGDDVDLGGKGGSLQWFLHFGHVVDFEDVEGDDWELLELLDEEELLLDEEEQRSIAALPVAMVDSNREEEQSRLKY